METQLEASFFIDSVLDNSFWKEQGAQPNDIIKAIDGEDVTLQNANKILGAVFGWKPGRDIEVKLERDGKEVIIKTTTTQGYTTGKALKPKENATDAQNTLRKAWLKG